MKKRIYTRQYYIDKIKGFYDSDLIKVVTGIRRYDKSCFLLSVMDYLKEREIPQKGHLYCGRHFLEGTFSLLRV